MKTYDDYVFVRPTLQQVFDDAEDKFYTGFAHSSSDGLAWVRMVIHTRLRSQEAHGSGNKAAKRMAQIETARWFDEVDAEQREAFEADFPAYCAAEGRLNFHDL